MVIDLIESAAKQMISDRMCAVYSTHEHKTWDAILLALGEKAKPTLGGLLSRAIPERSMTKYVEFGIHPSGAMDYELPVEHYSKGRLMQSHPIHLTAMFGGVLRSPGEAKRMYAEHLGMRQQNLDASRGIPKNPRYPTPTFHGLWGQTHVPGFSAEDCGIEPLEFDDAVDNIHFAAWYTQPSVRAIVERRLTTDQILTLIYITEYSSTTWRTELQSVVYASTMRDCTSDRGGSFHYAALAELLGFCTPEKARDVMDRLKGARRVLLITRPDSTTKDMTNGLRALATTNNEETLALLSRLGRTPAFEELSAVKGRGLVDILYYMPWEHLEAMLQRDEDRIRGLLLRHVDGDSISKVSVCLVDHRHRRISAKYRSKGLDSNWSTHYTALATQYTACRDLRSKLLSATGSPFVAVMAALDVLDDKADMIRSMLQKHPDYPKIESVQSEYRALPTDALSSFRG